MDSHEEKLSSRGIKPTALRLLVYRTMLTHPQAFSLSDLEARLGTVDKSTLSRTIHLFQEHLLIHSIDDGSGSIKYSTCCGDCLFFHQDQHVHFTCTRCKKTTCLKSLTVPNIQLPNGFLAENVNFVVKGLCDQCNKS